jgi:hypothetical protein
MKKSASTRRSTLLGVLVGLAASTVTVGCAESPSPDAATSATAATAATSEAGAGGASPQQAFFDHMASLCGQEFPGRAVIAPESDPTFRPAFLGMRIERCEESEIRIPFLVDGDESRTWILTLDGDDLVFTHEHMLEGDTLSSNSGWGGRAVAGSGTALFQHFPDHRWDPEQVPESRRSHWRMRLDPDHGQFVYYLDRGIEPAYRLVFHLGQDPALQASPSGL